MQAVSWTEAGPEHWSLRRRCPDCHWVGSGRHAQAEMERFDEALDDGMDELLDSLRALAAERMGEDVERFLVALDRDLVLPEDF